MAVIADVNRTITMDFKMPGNALYVVGETFAELAGSEYCACIGATGARVPQVRAEVARATMQALSSVIAAGHVVACHDMSEGGLAVALAEMAFSGELGAKVDLRAVPLGEPVERDDIMLFSESNSRFLVEVPLSHTADFEVGMVGSPCARVGQVVGDGIVRVHGLNGDMALSADIHELKAAWKRPLDW
jgi:phosphoribosylformylglycinamidine synthase subunit PurSL